MVKVVGFLGSPREGGNTDLLLQSALEGARDAGAEVEKVVLNDLDLRGCQECDECLTTGRCVIEDDMRRIYDLLETLDVIIVASPVFFSGLSSQTKAMVDRCQCLWARKYLLKNPVGKGRKRLGAFLSVGGRLKSDFRGAISVIRVFFINIDVELIASLVYPGIDRKGAILAHPTALEEARRLGRDLVQSYRGSG